ncbi:MAG: hypothetical protein NT084_10895 [Bacteroidetes bacterium]|nr:hypothetical protein [Bacteroidota bacterium]
MKFLALICLLISTISLAQTESASVSKENGPSKNELGLNLFSVTNFERGLSTVDKRQYSADFNLFSGVYYKYHFGKNAWRASFDFNQKSIFTNVAPNISYYYSENAKRNFIGLKAGYERKFGNRKLNAFVFSDLIFNYYNLRGVHSYSGCFGWGENVPFNEETFEYGLAGGAGIRYAISKNIALSYEFSAQGFCSVYQDILNSGVKWVEFGYHLNPANKLGFAIAF